MSKGSVSPQMCWALNTVLPSLVKEGTFGDVEFLDLRKDETKTGRQFASALSFVVLRALGKSGEVEFPIVVKAQTDVQRIRQDLDLKTEFYNEILMYKEILPQLGYENKYYANFYYGNFQEDGYERDVVVLENLKYKGFEKCRMAPFLDFKHISIALKRIALFHSLSYKLKHEDSNKFAQLVKKLRPLRHEEKLREENTLYGFKRGLNSYEETFGKSQITEDLRKFIKGGIVHMDFMRAEEPFDVINHGDFVNINIIYKYDGFGQPVDCALMDFQQAKYGSPASELAFYLYMHTTKKLREEYWDEFLKMYWETLMANLEEEVVLPSFEDFLKHFSQRAILGFVISSFFLPVLMVDNEVDMDSESADEELAKIGGEEATTVIRDVLHHVIERKYATAFLETIKK